MKLRYVIQLFLVSIAIFFAVFWWFENRYLHSINSSFHSLQNSTLPSLTALLELSSSARRASIKAVEFSMHGQQVDREKAKQAIANVSQNYQKMIRSEALFKEPEELKQIEIKVNLFKSLVDDYLVMSAGPSINQLFDKQEKIQRARRQLIHSFKPINSRLDNIQKLSAARIKSEARKVSVKLIEFSLRGNQTDKEKATLSINDLIAELEKFNNLTDVEDYQIKQVVESAESYLDVVETYLQSINLRNQPVEKIYQQEKRIHQARKALIHSLYPVIDRQYQTLDSVVMKASLAIDNADLIQKASSIIFIALAIFLGLILSKIIIRPIAQLNHAARDISQGKLDTKVAVGSKNEIGELAQAFNDMSQSLQSSKEYIEFMAYYDELTGLANRRLMIDRLERALKRDIRHAQHGAVLMLDIDRFKTVNDTLGHAAGDLLLKQVAERLEGLVREEDTISRLGSDEFVIILSDVDREEEDILVPVARIAEKILEAVALPYRIEKSLYKTTASVGVVLFPYLNDTAEALLKRADVAMSNAKKAGGDRVLFYENRIQQVADERLFLEKELQLAIERDELFLVYQPQCDALGRMVGIEALVRWDHPEKGLIAPPKFIGIAEEIGMIAKLGGWIFEQVCADMAKLMVAGELDGLAHFSINVSAYQFKDPIFIKTVLATLEKHQIPAAKLQLELTETALLDDVEINILRLKQLRDVGVRLSLDDFGTGYSSLSYLSKLPLDEIKIDRSFLLDAEKNPSAWSIIESIIDISEALKLQVVAEGVEQQQQLDRLDAIGCSLFQGYIFHKPMTFEKFAQVLKAQHQG